MKPLETLSVLPQGDGGRFGSLALGTDRVEKLREEHIALRQLAALVCGKTAVELSLEDVTAALALVAARAATPDVQVAATASLESALTEPAATRAQSWLDTALWLLAGTANGR